MLDSLRTAEVFDVRHISPTPLRTKITDRSSQPSVDCNSPDWTPVDAPHLSLEDHSLDVDTVSSLFSSLVRFGADRSATSLQFRELLETLDEELEDSDEEDDEDEDDSEDEEE